jgi:GNAT superfamily N-acetyltransferase/predicted GNAT family acetyltransferase
MRVHIREVENRKQLKEFIHLPARIHQNHPQWVPPIYKEEWTYFDPSSNREFQHSETVLALAWQNNEVSGRIMGIINHRYNRYRREKGARFAYLECWDNQEVAHALLSFLERWAIERNMQKIVGPMGFSDQDPEGFLIEGYEHEPTLATYFYFEYMIRLLEKEGYKKDVDYVVYKLVVPEKMPDFYRRIYRRISRNKNFRLIEFSKKNQLKPFIRPIFELMNDTFKDIYGYFPLDVKEMNELGKRYLPVIDPRFVKLVARNHEIVAFIIGIPNMAQGLREAKGRLFPFGVFKILRATRKTKQLDLYLGGIKEEVRGKGLDVMMGKKMIESCQKAGIEFMDSHHELEGNLKMRSEMERLGSEVYKRYRIFQKSLKT